MGWRLDKSIAEMQEFYHEVVVENGPRYKDWQHWHHLYVDLLNSFFDMSYTLSHIVAFALPVWALTELWL